eukprot:TRINITY_DN6321_c0_g1_i5.p1 TRINITY_DN6321_c0_g1~~TRINITY_DN6321_c0_g1_i5.p1  ORF type:complete len:462 (-),score=112.84 TRINITY_DN6321_c0_g1_i5:36-1421(-)
MEVISPMNSLLLDSIRLKKLKNLTSKRAFVTTQEGNRVVFEDISEPSQIAEPNEQRELLVSSVITTVFENYSKRGDVAPDSPKPLKRTRFDLNSDELLQRRSQLRKTPVSPSLSPKDNFTPKRSEPIPIPTSSSISPSDSSANQESSSWLLSFLSQLLGWLHPLGPEDDKSSCDHRAHHVSTSNDDQVWKDWEWVLSAAEELSKHQSEKEAERIQKELKLLRSSAHTFKLRNYFQMLASKTIGELPDEEKDLLQTPLDNSKRNKIISDVVNSLADSWMDYVIKFVLVHADRSVRKQFEDSYREKKYEKGVLGTMKELAFTSSNGPTNTGINERVLADILWSFWKTLTESIRTTGFDLEQADLILMADEMAEARDLFVRLWIDTVRNSRSGSKREGQVVKKWKEQEKEDELLNRSRILQQGVDAKYSIAKYQIPRKKVNDMKRLKETLESKLHFATSRAITA